MSFEKHSMKSTLHSPYSKIQDTEIDPYSPVIVEDLLGGVNEWRNIQDIIRLTFKALTDVVKAQGETLKELERQMPTRASKAELNSGLSLKANISDVSKTIAEVVTSLENKISVDDIHSVLRDYVLRSDFQFLMSNKAGIDEVKTLLDTRVSDHEFRGEIMNISAKFEDLYKETHKSRTNYVNQREFQALCATVDQKANINEMNEQLESKANKQSVANALHRKANRSDIEALLARKAEIGDVQNLLNALDAKSDLQSIDKIIEILDNKVDRSDLSLLNNAIHAKADRAEIEHASTSLSSQKIDFEHKIRDFDRKIEGIKEELENHRQSLFNQLNKKADAREFERLSSIVSKKSDSEHTSAVLNEIKNEIAEDVLKIRNDVLSFRRNIDEVISEKHHKTENLTEKLSEEVFKLNDQLKNVLEERRNDIEETAKFVKNVTSTNKKELQLVTDRLFADIEELKKTVDDLITRKLEKKEFVESRAKIFSELEGKVDLPEVQGALNSCQADISARFTEFREEVKNMVRNHENEIYTLLSKKANLNDLNSALQGKADGSSIHALLSGKASVLEFDDLKRKIEQIAHLVDEKINFRDFEVQVSHQKRILDDVQKEVILKANIKDVCTLLDSKSNIDEVNKALMDVHKELDTKSNQEEFAHYVNDQALINENLCTENILGRWAWKSGDVRNGGLVPWEIQLANTLSDNFLWEKEKTSILTVAPGLYEVYKPINLGFFAKKKPSVQVLVNGEPILNALNTSSNVIHQSTRKEIELTRNTLNMTGLTLVDFVMLPEKARISIVYTGESGGEGFIGLKRL